MILEFLFFESIRSGALPLLRLIYSSALSGQADSEMLGYARHYGLGYKLSFLKMFDFPSKKLSLS